MQRPNRAFTLLEVIIALILASILTIGSIKVIENMQHETERFRQQVDDDMTWLTANHHLAKNVRGSSYLEVSNGGNTLTLYNYDQTPKGVYVNDPVGHSITYNSIVAGTATTFRNVTATFSPPSAGPTGQGWRNNRNIEVVIDYALPFVNMLRLRCAADVKASSTWARTYGGGANDNGCSVQQTQDGGYIIVGSTDSFGAGSRDVYLIKTDINGVAQWSETLGGIKYDVAYSVRQTLDASGNPTGYILVGYTDSFEAVNYDVYLIKTYLNGAIEWSKRLNISGADYGVSVRQTFDFSGNPNGYVIAGWTSSGNPVGYVMKTDINGTQEWLYPSSSRTDFFSVQQTNDGGYIAAGMKAVPDWPGMDLYVLLSKITPVGAIQWSKPFGDGFYSYMAYSVQQTTDGGYITAGLSTHGAYLIRTNSSGTKLWSNNFGGSSNSVAMSVQQTQDGGYILVGYTGGNGDVCLFKTDVSGAAQWSRTFGGSANDGAMSVQQTLDGGYIVAGHTNSFGAGGSDVYLIKTDSQGNCPEASSPIHDPGGPNPPGGWPVHDTSVPS
jgi:prepilin-type N-terminal cleavage/methylation domain-containing protein